MGDLAEAIHRLNEALRALGFSAPRDITMRTHEEWLQLAAQLRAHLAEQGIPPASDAPISTDSYTINICGTTVRSPNEATARAEDVGITIF